MKRLLLPLLVLVGLLSGCEVYVGAKGVRFATLGVAAPVSSSSAVETIPATSPSGHKLGSFYPAPILIDSNNNITWPANQSPGTIQETSESSAIKGADILIQPQQSTHATDQGGGNLLVNIQAPAGAGADADMIVQRGGVNEASIGYRPQSGYNLGATLGLGVASVIQGLPASQTLDIQTNNGALLLGAGSNNLYIEGGSIIATSNSGGLLFRRSGTEFSLLGNVGIDSGGGSNVVTIVNDASDPTGSSVGGGEIWEQAIGLHFTGPSTSFQDYMIAPVQQGSVNTQQNKFRLYSGPCRTTTTTAVTCLTIPVATSGSVASMDVQCSARDVTSGTVGDSFSYNNTVGFKNVGGTVTAATVQGTALNSHDTSMATCGVSYTISSTNVLVQPTGLTSVTIDWTCNAQVIVN